MRYSTASTVAFAAAAVASPLAAPQSPSTPAPAGCSPNYDGKFQIQVVNATTSAKRSVEKRQDGKLEITLANGVLTDAQGRIGNIVANNQFQFDPAPGQAGAIYTSGWSVCQNGSLAIGGDAQFYQCLSGTFYNLYDEATAAQCYPVFINVIGGAQSSQASTASGLASTLADGQVTGTNVATAPVSQISDGQLQATSAVPVSQISDGQLQNGSPVTQISDGQIQASSAAPAYTSAASTTAAPVTQIPDGQLQIPTTSSVVSPISQISDGQIQAPTGNSTVQPTGSNVISAPTGTGSPIAYDGAASSIHATGLGLFAVLAMAFAL